MLYKIIRLAEHIMFTHETYVNKRSRISIRPSLADASETIISSKDELLQNVIAAAKNFDSADSDILNNEQRVGDSSCETPANLMNKENG